MPLTNAVKYVNEPIITAQVSINRFLKGYDDECVTAAEMYACGKEKSPAVVGSLLTAKTGNLTYVRSKRLTSFGT
jgi:hypothetical protein